MAPFLESFKGKGSPICDYGCVFDTYWKKNEMSEQHTTTISSKLNGTRQNEPLCSTTPNTIVFSIISTVNMAVKK